MAPRISGTRTTPSWSRWPEECWIAQRESAPVPFGSRCRGWCSACWKRRRSHESYATAASSTADERTCLLASQRPSWETMGLPAVARADPTPEPPTPGFPPDVQAQVDEAEQRVGDLFSGWASVNGWLVQFRLDPAGGIFETPLFGLSATTTPHSGAPAVNWGGTYDTPQPSHFEIVLGSPDAKLQEIAAAVGHQIIAADA